jgi:hypothetical protein
VPEHRSVLHEAVVEEDLLTALDIALGVEGRARGIHDAVGDWRLRLVGPVRQQPEDEEAEEHYQDDGLDPSLRDEQCPPFSLHADLLLRCERVAAI